MLWFAVALLVLVLLAFGQVRGVLGADYHGPLRKEKSSCYIGGYESVTEAVSREDSCAGGTCSSCLTLRNTVPFGSVHRGTRRFDHSTVFVTKAFNDELKFTDLYDASAGVKLSGAMDKIEFSSTSGWWDLALTLRSEKGLSYTTANHHDCAAMFAGPEACSRSAQALGEATQDLIIKAVSHWAYCGMATSPNSL